MLRWFAVALWMGLIFVLSSTPSLQLPSSPFDDLLLRTLAHIGEYAVLTALLWWALRRYTGSTLRTWLLAMLAAGLYACFDEWHQSWMAGRHGSFRNVGMDAIGIVGFYVLVQRGRFEGYATRKVRPCPRCHGERLYRSRRRGMIEWCVRFIGLYPFRCDICGHRFRRFTRSGR